MESFDKISLIKFTEAHSEKISNKFNWNPAWKVQSTNTFLYFIADRHKKQCFMSYLAENMSSFYGKSLKAK